jgi:plasmid stabilization system protein ParE
MAYKYEFNDIFLKDIEEIIFYLKYSLFNEQAAQKLVKEVIISIEKIIEFPFSFPDCRKLFIDNQNIRHKKIKNYIIFYKVEKDKVSFIRFRYSKLNKLI